MQNTSSTKPGNDSPFFELLADAEAVKIREVREENPQNLASSVERSIKDFGGKTDGVAPGAEGRTFLVHIKSKPAPVPTPTPEPPANRLYLLKSAELLLAEGDFVLARNIYSYLLRVNLRDCEALQGLGTCFLRLGEATHAKKCFKALVEIDGKPESFLFLGQCFVAEKDEEAALESFLKVTKPESLSPALQFELFKELGNCQTRRAKHEEAWAYYHKALAANPASDIIYVNLGTLELQRQHVEIAGNYFTKAVELNPLNARAHCGIGMVAIVKEDLGAAEKAFHRALDIDPLNQVALFQLASHVRSKPSYQSLKARIFKFLQNDPKNADVHYALAVTLFKEGNWAECEREIALLLSLDPNHAKGRHLKEELNSNKHRPI